jgi:hypothetical protein
VCGVGEGCWGRGGAVGRLGQNVGRRGKAIVASVLVSYCRVLNAVPVRGHQLLLRELIIWRLFLLC